MSTKIFVNLPVRDLDASRVFFTALGFSFDDRFSDQNAACLVIDDSIYAMLLVESFFTTFTTKEIVDATRATEAILALAVESKQRVDEVVDAALAAGGRAGDFSTDEGWMYGRSFSDPDGHNWEVLWMDPATAQG